MLRNWVCLIAAAGLMGVAGCADQSAQSAYRDPATGLPGCVSRNGVLPSSGSNRPVQTANSLPVGAKDLSPSCVQRDVSHPYAAP